jgi:hypothetical protein
MLDYHYGQIDATTPPRYADADAKPGFLKGIPFAGTINARMCEDCGRILLYGVPSEQR